MHLSFIILLLYNITISCSELYFPLFNLNKDQLNTVLFFYAEPQKTSVYNYDTRKDKEETVIGLDGIKKLKELKLVCKDFIPHVDHILSFFPLVCCDNLIIPCVPFAPKTPIVHIKFNASNEYEVDLKLYFKSSLEDRNDGYLFLQWQYQTAFNENSCIKKILDKHCDGILYNAKSQPEGPSSPRSHYLRAIKKIVADTQKERDCTKHYSYFAKHFKNSGLPHRGPDHGARFILKCLNKDLVVLERGGCHDDIFPSDVFIKSTFINIPIPNPFIIFSLKALNDRASSYPGINPSLIQPILQEHIINLEQCVEKLQLNDFSSLLKTVKKWIKKMNTIEDCFKKLSYPRLSEEKNIINTLKANLNKAKDLFLNAFSKKYTLTNNNITEMWLWEKTSIFIKYLIEKNESFITNETEVKKTIAKMLTIIRLVLSLNDFKEEATSAEKRIFTQWETVVLYSQKAIFNLFSKTLSSSGIIDTINSNDRLFDKIYTFFNFCDFNKDGTVTGKLTLERRTALTMTPSLCECARKELEKKFQKQLKEKQDSEIELQKVSYDSTQNIIHYVFLSMSKIEKPFNYKDRDTYFEFSDIIACKKFICSLLLINKIFYKAVTEHNVHQYFYPKVFINGNDPVATFARRYTNCLGEINIKCTQEYEITLKMHYGNQSSKKYDSLLLWFKYTIRFAKESKINKIINAFFNTNQSIYKGMTGQYCHGNEQREQFINWLKKISTNTLNKDFYIPLIYFDSPLLPFLLNFIVTENRTWGLKQYGAPTSWNHHVFRFEISPFIKKVIYALTIENPIPYLSITGLKIFLEQGRIPITDETKAMITDIAKEFPSKQKEILRLLESQPINNPTQQSLIPISKLIQTETAYFIKRKKIVQEIRLEEEKKEERIKNEQIAWNRKKRNLVFAVTFLTLLISSCAIIYKMHKVYFTHFLIT